jgi:hypothetical protein
MSSFEYIFSLFGLLLGLSLAEVLGGLIRTLKLRRKVRVGWLTPMLGVFVLLDLLSFWTGAWGAREVIPLEYVTLVYGLAVTGAYYMAASLVFPADPEEWPNFDDYFFMHRRQVLIAVWMCNNAVFPVLWFIRGDGAHPWTIGVVAVYSLLVIAACLSARRWVSAVALVGLVGVYVLEVIGSAVNLATS